MGIAFFVALALIEIIFFMWSARTGSRHTAEKAIVRIAAFAILVILLLTGALTWGFRYYGILLVLAIQAILGVVQLVRKQEKPYTTGKSVTTLASCLLMYAFALLPAFLFPEYASLDLTGQHTVATAEYIWTDESRDETFTAAEDHRVVNVDFWYPQEPGAYPLVIFSHGAFGLSYSNESTFSELASNGYVVASIGHPYHAFYAQSASGSPIIVDMDFLRSVYAISDMEDGPEKQAITDGWMDLRSADMRFVLTTIAQQVDDLSGAPFERVNLDKIGLIGHSLGGATAAQVGREWDGIDAVIMLDTTMLGEIEAYEGQLMIFNNEPYPVPLLSVYTKDHYDEALLYGNQYPNFYAAAHSTNIHEAIIKDAGHLNFTDLPLFSPLLARVLGVGSVDARYAIETTNALTLAFFDYALKDGAPPQYEKEY